MMGGRSDVKSKLRRGVGGYTIIEVMIVLAASGGLLVAVMATISGQTQRTQFTTGVRDFETKLQDMVNDVRTGYYSNNGSTSCDPNPTAGNPPIVGGAARSQGTNAGCIFLGKAIQFYSPTGANLVNYREVTIAGARKDASGDVTNIDNAAPVPFNRNGNGVVEGALYNGIELTGIKHYTTNLGDTPTDSYGLLILSSISTVTNSGQTIASASGRPRLGSIDATATDNDGSNLAGKINSTNVNSAAIDSSAGGVVFCLREGGPGGRIAAITLGIRLNGATKQSTGQSLSTQTYFEEEAGEFLCAS